MDQKEVWRWLNSQASKSDFLKSLDKYRSNPLAVDIAHKRIRLDGMNRERLRILREIADECGDKGVELGRIPKKGWSRYTTLLKRLIAIYDKAREEIEKRPESLAIFTQFIKSEVGDEELRRQIAEIDAQLLEFRRAQLSAPKGGEDAGAQGPNKGKSA
jgi:hypothetical protein